MARLLSQDWERLYEHPIYFLETFVDPERFRGTCYRAANWVMLGRTTGRGKDDHTNRPNRSIKEVLGLPVHRRFRELLQEAGSMKAPDPEGIPRIDVSTKELEALLEQAKQEPLREEGYHKLKAAIRTLGYVTELLEKKETTLAALRELLCSASTEKTDKVLKQAGINTGEKKPESPSKKPKRTAAGHGRNSAAAYSGAQKVKVPHASLKAGDACPDGCGGKVYPQREPGVLVRIKGQAPLAATVYELEKLRCNLCGNVYTAEAPADAGEKKYDESAAAMIALLRYGSGVPWNRTEGLEANLGIPLPAATQCEIMAQTALPLQPALEELKRQAAQAEVVHNDDTSMRVLSLDRDADISPERTGVFTSGLVWIVQERRIALYFTGCKHAGENLAEVLKLRSPDLPPIIQMCDALSRNVPKLVETLVANCNAHGRRNFVKVTAEFSRAMPICAGNFPRGLRL